MSAVFVNWKKKEVYLNHFVCGPDGLDEMIKECSKPQESAGNVDLAEYQIHKIELTKASENVSLHTKRSRD